MIRIGSLADVALETGTETGTETAGVEPTVRSWPHVPEQRGSLESSSTSS